MFDHILANRYLKEKDAQKLFAQLISGVDYLHKRHIIHRDLKLENLLLDKHRNIIITDFGFANRFNHSAEDLMATSCGSPCYAAPELVVSEGLYVGSAVDIWSCGVILYAMLSGYLPYDDDPANPDGDNINQLYKYIMNTKLNIPDHTSPQAKHLLQIMLVPNPEYRCRIEQIMDHPWLSGQRDLFDKTVAEHEFIWQENMNRKSHLAQRELLERKRIQQEAKMQKAMQRSQSSHPGSAVTASMLDHRRAKETRHQSALPGATTMPEYLSNAGHRTPPLVARPLLSIPASVPAAAETPTVIAEAPIVLSPISALSINASANTPPSTPPRKRAESLAPTLSQKKSGIPSLAGQSTMAVENESMSVEPSPEARPALSANKNRHTIQVEYDGEASYEKMTDELEAKRSAIRSQHEGSPKPRQPHPVVQLTSSDVEMESESSDGGHVGEIPAESPAALTTSEAPTPGASQILLTPLTTSLPATHDLDFSSDVSAPSTSPVTPSKQLQHAEVSDRFGSPSTPRASTNNTRDEVVTPRYEPSTVATPKASIRQSGKYTASIPPGDATSVPATTQVPPFKAADLKSSGLPNVPPPKRDRTRKGMSMDKFGFAKLLGQTQSSSEASRAGPPSSGGSAAAIQAAQVDAMQREKRNSNVRPRTADVTAGKDKRSSRRRTLQLMVNRSVQIARDMHRYELTSQQIFHTSRCQFRCFASHNDDGRDATYSTRHEPYANSSERSITADGHRCRRHPASARSRTGSELTIIGDRRRLCSSAG